MIALNVIRLFGRSLPPSRARELKYLLASRRRVFENCGEPRILVGKFNGASEKCCPGSCSHPLSSEAPAFVRAADNGSTSLVAVSALGRAAA